MARGDVPDPLAIRSLRYDPASPVAERDAVARALRTQGRHVEAVMLYEGRGGDPALEADAAWAVESGSSFGLLALERVGFAVTDERRRACARAAEAKGRWYDAHRLYERLQDAESLARVQEKIPGFKVAVPENKK
jgi:hypothetical protein